MLSIAISLKSRELLLSCRDVATSSPRWKKTAETCDTYTAHTVMVSLCSADNDHRAFIWQSMSGLIGRRGDTLLADLRMPLSTRDNFGIGVDLGSGRLYRMCTCKCCTADKYLFMILYSGKFSYGANFHMCILHVKIKSTKISAIEILHEL